MSEQQAASVIAKSEYTHQQPAAPAPPLVPNPSPDGDGVYLALRDGYKIQKVAGRRALQRTHEFDDIETFAAYLNRHTAGQRERAEIIVSDATITAGLDPRNPIGDLVTCQLAPDPRFAAWCSALEPRSGCAGNPILSQKELHALMRAQAGDFSDEQVSALMLHAVRNLAVVTGGKRDSQLDERGFYRILGELNDRKIDAQLPAEFTILVPVFEGVRDPEGAPELYEIDVLLSLHEQGSGVVFSLEAPALPRIRRQARRDAAVYLRSLLDKELLVGLGHYDTTDVPAGTTTDANTASGTERLVSHVVKELARLERESEVDGDAGGKAL